MRECDERTARVLLDLGVATSNFDLWNRAPRGTLSYVNDSSQSLSAMSYAQRNKNIDAVEFLCNAGGVITDCDYLKLRCRGQVRVRSILLSMVMEVLSSSETTMTMSEDANNDPRASDQADSVMFIS
jgi:hypothetical protein